MEQITFIDQQGSGEKPGPFAMPGEGQPTAGDVPGFIEDYNAVKEAHPKDIVLYQVGDFFEMFGPDARAAASLLDLNLTTRTLPDVGRVAMCGFPAGALNGNIEKLRGRYSVTVSEVDKASGNRVVYFMGAYPKGREQTPTPPFPMMRSTASCATAPATTTASSASPSSMPGTAPPRTVPST